VNVETFKLFMHWLYTGRLEYVDGSDDPRKADRDDSDNGQHQSASKPRWNWETTCASDAAWDDDGPLDLHIFADKYDVPQLRLETMRVLQRGYSETDEIPAYSTIIKAFENLPETSPLCRWLTDISGYYRSFHEDGEEEMALHSELPKAFLVGALLIRSRLYQGDDEDDNLDQFWCKYHEHDSKEQGKACDKIRKRELLIRKALDSESECEKKKEAPAKKKTKT